MRSIYDQLSRIKYINDTTAATMEQYTYTYDKRGNILTESLYNTHGGTTSLTKAYVYDSLSRLTKTTVGSDVTDYAYDSTGNRYSEKSRQGGGGEWYDKYHYYNEFDQLTEVTYVGSTNAQAIERYTYNARGAMSTSESRLYNGIIWDDYDDDPNTPDTWEYEYDSWPQWYATTYTYDKAGYLQKSFEQKAEGITETIGHFYNGMEQRVRKITDADTTKYIYSGSALLFTTDSNNDKITEHVLSPNGQVIASQRFSGSYDGNYYFYNTDIRNSTMSIISDTYSPVKYYSYDEYGKQNVAGSSSFINDSTYTGSVSEGGNIFYMMARFYDANNGRFLTQDSYRGNAYEPMSQNLYSYVGNNPVNYVDPTGHRRMGFDEVEETIAETKAREYEESWDAYCNETFGEDAKLYKELDADFRRYLYEYLALVSDKSMLTDSLSAISTKKNEWYDRFYDRSLADNFIDFGSITIAGLATSVGYFNADIYTDAMISLDNIGGELVVLNLEIIGTKGTIRWTDKDIWDAEIKMDIAQWRIDRLYKKHND